MLFGKPKIDLKMIEPTSKMSLKMSCLIACRNDVKRAEELYAFLSEGIESLPDFDIPRPTVMQQVQQGAGQVFSWIKENREDIMNAVGYIQSLRTGAQQSSAPTPNAASAQAELPPLPNPMEG